MRLLIKWRACEQSGRTCGMWHVACGMLHVANGACVKHKVGMLSLNPDVPDKWRIFGNSKTFAKSLSVANVTVRILSEGEKLTKIVNVNAVVTFAITIVVVVDVVVVVVVVVACAWFPCLKFPVRNWHKRRKCKRQSTQAVRQAVRLTDRQTIRQTDV